MKILHVINSLAAGGAEKIVRDLANQQVNYCEVGIFTFYSDNDMFQNNLKNQVKYYPQKENSYLSYSKIRKLISLVKYYDVIHVHLFPAFYIVGLFSIFIKRIYVFTEHSTSNRRRHRLFWYLDKVIYSRYDKIVCISEGVKESLIKWQKNTTHKAIVIQNFINLAEVGDISGANVNPYFPKANVTKVLIMVGSFRPAKDQDTVIKAVSLLPSNFGLLLIGGGERRCLVEILAAKYKLADRVTFLGFRPDVYSILKGCHYGVLSSHYEGFGIAALEYMACDLVAIGSDVPGLNEVIVSPSCLFPVGDHARLANIIMHYDQNKQSLHKLKEKQKQHILKYDVKRATELYLMEYKKLIKKRYVA